MQEVGTIKDAVAARINNCCLDQNIQPLLYGFSSVQLNTTEVSFWPVCSELMLYTICSLLPSLLPCPVSSVDSQRLRLRIVSQTPASNDVTMELQKLLCRYKQ